VALGWVFDSDGNSKEEWFGSKPINDRSAHQRLKEIGRLCDAISAAEETCSTVTSRPSPGSMSVLLELPLISWNGLIETKRIIETRGSQWTCCCYSREPLNPA
jgi:hypothetical protein